MKKIRTVEDIKKLPVEEIKKLSVEDIKNLRTGDFNRLWGAYFVWCYKTYNLHTVFEFTDDRYSSFDKFYDWVINTSWKEVEF